MLLTMDRQLAFLFFLSLWIFLLYLRQVANSRAAKAAKSLASIQQPWCLKQSLILASVHTTYSLKKEQYCCKLSTRFHHM